MNETVDYLPLGSIVIIRGGIRKYMIIARGLNVDFKGEKHFFDYGGCMYPEGLVGDQVLYFQHANISKVVFEGYSDEDDRMMVGEIRESYEKLGIAHADTNELKKDLEM